MAALAFSSLRAPKYTFAPRFARCLIAVKPMPALWVKSLVKIRTRELQYSLATRDDDDFTSQVRDVLLWVETRREHHRYSNNLGSTM